MSRKQSKFSMSELIRNITQVVPQLFPSQISEIAERRWRNWLLSGFPYDRFREDAEGPGMARLDRGYFKVYPEIDFWPHLRGGSMGRFVEGLDRRQSWLLRNSLDDYVTEDNPVRVVEAFIDERDLSALGFTRFEPAATGRPAYHPATLLKLYLHGYLNQVPSSRRLEREAPIRARARVWGPF